MKVDFYRVDGADYGRVEFQNALVGAMSARGENRSRMVLGERIDLYVCERSDSIIEGEIGRVRMNDTPAIANPDCTVAEIPLDDDQGIAERTAFLYDCDRGILVLHAKREAASASRVAGFCNYFRGRDVEPFSLSPILRPNAERKFRSMQRVRKIEVEYSRGAQQAMPNPDSSTRSFVKGLADMEGETLFVAISAGRKRRSELSLERVREVVRTALTGREEVVRKLTVSGTGAGDEALLIDLLEDRLRANVAISFRGRTPSYEQRRVAVRKAHSSHTTELR